MIEHDWFGLYAESWTGEIVPDAFSHPAKFSRALIRKIYQHLLEQGYIRPGDRILDTFGGVALGALDAMRYGLHWHGVELEPRFVALGQQNIDEWNRRYAGWFAAWGTAQIIQGDSRRLVELVGQAAGVVSSPPYAGSATEKNSTGVNLEKQYETYRAQGGGASFENFEATQLRHSVGYGSTPGQLGSMREGDIDAAISSPPYTGSGLGNDAGIVRLDEQSDKHREANGYKRGVGYGTTPGNLGAMVEGVVDGTVASPPFENQLPSHDNFTAPHDSTRLMAVDYETAYGDHPANIGNDSGDTFWQAARVILEQTYAVLKPGGVAAWVTGNFRRNGQIVDFGGQWLALCESIGFVGMEHIRAWKVERRPEQLDIFGNAHNGDIHRTSFFRRLDNAKNPGQEILHEDVWIVRKGGDARQP